MQRDLWGAGAQVARSLMRLQLMLLALALYSPWVGTVAISGEARARYTRRAENQGDASSGVSLSTTCSDRVADDYDPGVLAPARYNSECTYSCTKLRKHFALKARATVCWIDSGPDLRWPPAPLRAPKRGVASKTYTVPPSTAAVVQGHAGPRGQSFSRLGSRINVSDASSCLIIRHVSMQQLKAAKQVQDYNNRVGGAVFVFEGALTVEHCIFYGNYADHAGGAISVIGGKGGTRIADSTFDSNSANGGGAVSLYRTQKDVVITGCVFEKNEADGNMQNAEESQGGAIYSENNIGQILVTGSSFNRNEAISGGGAITLNANTDVVVENCSFMENLVSKDGYNPEIGGAAIHIVTVEEPYHIGKGFSEAVVANCRGQENQPCAVAWVTLEGVNKGCRRETSGSDDLTVAQGYWGYLSLTKVEPGDAAGCLLSPLPEYVTTGTCLRSNASGVSRPLIPANGTCRPSCSTSAVHDDLATCSLDSPGLLVGVWRGFCACDEGLHFVLAETPGAMCSSCPRHSAIRPRNMSQAITECVCNKGYKVHGSIDGKISSPTDVCELPTPPETNSISTTHEQKILILSIPVAILVSVLCVFCCKKKRVVDQMRKSKNHFDKQMGETDFLHGIEEAASSSLEDAVVSITGPKQQITDPEHKAICDDYELKALVKAKKLLRDGPDEYGLSEDEIAAIYLYTLDDMYTPLNRALFSKEHRQVKPYFAYIRILQQALFKLPKCQAGTIFRAIDNQPRPNFTPYTQEGMLELAIEKSPNHKNGGSRKPITWWGFSSCSTNLQAMQKFLGQDGKRMQCIIEGGSSARSIAHYSDRPDEDEVLMPFGASFTVVTANVPATDLLNVVLRPTYNFELGGHGQLERNFSDKSEPEPEPEPEPALGSE